MVDKKPRLSLTKTQIQAGVGAELLALCQSVTEDGSLSKDEILAFRDWLQTNRYSDLPAIDFLATTLERIITDGKVTNDERREMYKAIEIVLPPETRRHASERRKTVEAEGKAQVQEERVALKQQEREERERRRPLYSANFMVAGVHYEGRPEVIREYADDDDQVFLVRDPRNKYSSNAVEVRLQNGMQIGFVPEYDAGGMAPFLDQDCPYNAYITTILTGGRVPIPVVQTYIYRADAGVDGLVFPSTVPDKQVRVGTNSVENSRKCGCLSVVLLAVVLVMWGVTGLL